ncbi:UNVERIFIED_CONTAM: hypothetical protein PYX00_005587 [Menopon gallinae]|uniref:tRNA (carboxymethyluridine(34)-5-O)-methyltransferase n=1 Tax=Menopon gallinae TaxID=328185 RepID=A0AAW2HTU6_9NEOP
MSFSQMKLRRKINKYQNIIMNDYGVSLSQFPSRVLMICNGGLVNSISQENIFEVFSAFGPIENIVMIPEKSYSFLVFKDMSSAEAAYTRKNNQEIWPSIKGPVYLAFLEKLPETVNVTINFNNRPSGLHVVENFITEEEEVRILKCLGHSSEDETKSSELKNRKVYHFGYEFKYNNNNVDVSDPIKEIPKELDFVWDRLLEKCPDLGLEINFRPDQLTVNNYQPGQGIPSHVDTHSAFEDPIVSLSLQSGLIMDFKDSDGRSCSVFLPERSLCVMSGDSRYGWTHGIATRKSDMIPGTNGGLTLHFRKERTSLTFRKIRQRKCNCSYPLLCDTPSRELQKELEKIATKLEESYVHEVYEKISDHFSETRHKPWPNVLKFVQSLPVGSILVDFGCGNGKYFNKESLRFEIGLDTSFNLMEVCRNRGFECFCCNCLQVPLRDNIADGCISIAVIHHLVTEERRKKAISEMVRILKPNGRALIYVWAKNQERQNKKSSYLKQNTRKSQDINVEEKNVVLNDIKADLTLPVHTNRTNFVHNDLLVPWKLKDKHIKNEGDECPVYLRYYHVFEDEELKELCRSFTNIEILDYYYDQGNWCIMLQKI